MGLNRERNSPYGIHGLRMTQKLQGYADVSAALIYTHGLNESGRGDKCLKDD